MLLNIEADPRDHSTCALSYNEAEGWMEATWRGYVDTAEAMRGAEAYLQYAAPHPCAFLFNNNSELQGPWFDSLDWLLHVWVPQATRLGLRYVAHLMQADHRADILSRSPAQLLPFELQVFHNEQDAREWLRSMQQRAA